MPISRRKYLNSGMAALGLAMAGSAFTSSDTSRTSKTQKRFKPIYSKLLTQAADIVQASNALSPVPDPEVRILRRLTFGYQPGNRDYFNSLGANLDERLENWVDEQLDGYQAVWPPADDPQLTAVLNDPIMTWETLGDDLTTLWQERAAAGQPENIRDLPTYETTSLTVLRAVYSKWQLAEVLADFWHVHFSVDASGGERRSTTVHYDRDVIRTHMLGNFRQFLESVTKSCSMMHYLDNLWNSKYGPNENFARELQELHTLGALNSWGFTPEGDIPEVTPIDGSSIVLPEGLKTGYSEEDVRQVTRCLTGWTIDRREITRVTPETGAYMWYPDWHDESPKRVLGRDIVSNGEDEVKEVLDLLAIHPNTARYVCYKLCRRLVNDDPPPSLVEKAAKVFNEQWQAADQLKQVVRTILLSPEFKDAVHWGSKVKKPMELVCGLARSCGGFTSRLGAWRWDEVAPTWEWWYEQGEDFTFTSNFYWGMQQTGGAPFRWVTPDGYPDYKEAWLSSSPLVMGWKLVNSLFVMWRPKDPPNEAEWYHFFPIDAVSVTRDGLAANDRTPAKIVDFWVRRMLGYDAGAPGTPQLDTAVRDKLVAFLQQDAANPDVQLDLDMPPGTWNNMTWMAYIPERVQTLVATIAMLPDNLLR